MTKHKEIITGSVLESVQEMNGNTNCYFEGNYQFLVPRPFGAGCSEFAKLCALATQVRTKSMPQFKTQAFLTYQKSANSYAMYHRDIDNLNYHEVKLVDIMMKSSGVAVIDFSVDESEAPYEICIPFKDTSHIQLTADVCVGSCTIQTVIITFMKGSVTIHELKRIKRVSQPKFTLGEAI